MYVCVSMYILNVCRKLNVMDCEVICYGMIYEYVSFRCLCALNVMTCNAMECMYICHVCMYVK